MPTQRVSGADTIAAVSLGDDCGGVGQPGGAAVVAGTATAVSNRVSRRQANRWSQQEDQQYQQQQIEQGDEDAKQMIEAKLTAKDIVATVVQALG